MIIHDNTKDYYDSASGFGIDTALHYKRELKMNPVEAMSYGQKPEFDFPYREQYGERTIQAFLIGFCGAYFPGVKIFRAAAKLPDFLYSYAEYKAISDGYKKTAGGRRYWGHYGRTFKEFFERYEEKKSDEDFLKYHAPLFVVDYDNEQRLRVFANQTLKDYRFYKIKDAFTAFQEISVYLGNQLTGEKTIEEVDDKYKISQHGFDKFSFRHPIK